LQFVFTEQGTAWVPEFLASLDYFFDRMRNAVGSQEREWGLPIVEKMALQPSEYWARQCHIGASFIRPSEVPIREQVGVDRIMWGSDYPHKESSHPFSKEAIRLSFAGVDPVEVQMMLAGNAAALYGFDLDALAPIGDRIGPVVGEVARPLSPADFPEGSQKCPAFADPALAVL
jgi:predicted TIM-barrel fold metal-dependent hydrolase